jgi:hypothetical protein
MDLIPTAPSTLDESRDPIERQHAELHALACEWASAAT